MDFIIGLLLGLIVGTIFGWIAHSTIYNLVKKNGLNGKFNNLESTRIFASIIILSVWAFVSIYSIMNAVEVDDNFHYLAGLIVGLLGGEPLIYKFIGGKNAKN